MTDRLCDRCLKRKATVRIECAYAANCRISPHRQCEKCAAQTAKERDEDA